MPERRRIPPEDDHNRSPKEKQPTQPIMPPELPDAEATRLQTIQDQTRYMSPVKDTRLNPSAAEVEKPKRSLPPDQGHSVEKPKRSPQTALPVRQADRPKQRQSPFHLPIWSVLLMLMAVAGSAACIVVAVLALGGRSAPAAPPEFVVISAVPSTIPDVSIPSVLATATLPQQPVPPETGDVVLSGPTLAPIIYTATPTQPPEITIGSTIEIIGNQGINIRNDAGTENGVVKVANPGERYTVMDGPRQSNGLNWWQISDPATGITGWAAENDGTTDLFQVVIP